MSIQAECYEATNRSVGTMTDMRPAWPPDAVPAAAAEKQRGPRTATRRNPFVAREEFLPQIVGITSPSAPRPAARAPPSRISALDSSQEEESSDREENRGGEVLHEEEEEEEFDNEYDSEEDGDEADTDADPPASGSSGLDHIVRPGGLKDGVNNKKLNEGIEGLEE